MLNIKIICVGKIKEKYFVDAISEYQKRMKTMCKFEIIEVSEHKVSDNPSDSEILKCLEIEGQNIIKKIDDKEYIITMCIEGEQVPSEKLSEKIEQISLSGQSKICFVIGGSFGICDSLKQKSKFKLSMSKMTFPHTLARVMLVEQIYRALSINQGSKYHK